MDIVMMADLHELHSEVVVPPADLVLIAGDWTMNSRSLHQVASFNEWLGNISAPVILTPGNHEFYLEEDEGCRYLTKNGRVLINEGAEIGGLKIWASPVTPLYGGAFGMSSPADRLRHWAKIPDDTHVLITHGPPFGILDQLPGENTHHGDPELFGATKRLKNLRLHLFGHIHGAFGILEINGVTYVNASLMGTDGALAHSPIALRLPFRR